MIEGSAAKTKAPKQAMAGRATGNELTGRENQRITSGLRLAQLARIELGCPPTDLCSTWSILERQGPYMNAQPTYVNQWHPSVRTAVCQVYKEAFLGKRTRSCVLETSARRQMKTWANGCLLWIVVFMGHCDFRVLYAFAMPLSGGWSQEPNPGEHRRESATLSIERLLTPQARRLYYGN
jgi:hypothetical protein